MTLEQTHPGAGFGGGQKGHQDSYSRATDTNILTPSPQKKIKGVRARAVTGEEISSSPAKGLLNMFKM